MLVHDKEIVGISHDKNAKTLTLYFDDDCTLRYQNVDFFCFDNFSDQNVIFDIYEFNSNNISIEVIESFPGVKSFIQSDNAYKYYYVYSSAGAVGVIVTSGEK